MTAWQTFRRGLALTPEFRQGLGGTVTLALVATAGRVVVPLAVQQAIDHGLREERPDVAAIRWTALLCAIALTVTAVAAYSLNRRLYRTTETGLAALRVATFRHLHALPLLHQQAERRGALVSRVTSDIDQISTFMQWGGVLLVVSSAQLLIATVVMAVFSWQLTLVVYACFLPLALVLRVLQRRLVAAFLVVREKVARMLSTISESVVGVPVLKAHGAEAWAQARLDVAIAEQQRAATWAQVLTAVTFTTGELVAALANAMVVVVGVVVGVDGSLTPGALVGFLFLVTLFVGPVQVSTEVLNEAQNAMAGWGRVLSVLDIEPDVADPGASATPLPPGPLEVAFNDVGYSYPGGPPVLSDVTLRFPPRARVAVVGETGSGKTTLARLLVRLMDPTSGTVALSGVPLAAVSFAELRRRVVMVPQDGFLFDATVADNVRYGAPGLSDVDVEAAFVELGLGDWLATLPHGVGTRTGQRGELLSVGERQLVAVARAYVADPDLLVLDEATSSVDPATDVRLSAALDGLAAGRTTVTIAHRLSTAESADEVVVVDGGRVVQRGHHSELVSAPGPYAELHASWARRR